MSKHNFIPNPGHPAVYTKRTVCSIGKLARTRPYPPSYGETTRDALVARVIASLEAPKKPRVFHHRPRRVTAPRIYSNS